MKKLVFILFVIVNLIASSDYDKDIIVLDQSRDDKIRIVFSELMQYYEEEDSHAFFNLVSEERFIQDYMTFSEAIDEDFRKYEIITVDTWIDKITSDGVKRFLYVKWEKRYETNDGKTQLTQRGYSRFLFDEINGEYKLIELAGNHLWGNSLADWKEEVGTIAGQEPDEVQNSDGSVVSNDDGLPDLIISNIICGTSMVDPHTIVISNIGSADANPIIAIIPLTGIVSSSIEYNGVLSAGTSENITYNGDCSPGYSMFEIDPDDFIEEEIESNNTYSIP